MKNYNKILEAVNKGIQLALDDFDDEEQIQNIKSKQVYNRDYTKEYLDAMEQFVDLGLPSGNLWCKYNLGASVSKMKDISHAERNDYIGGFYAWGETKEKEGIEFKKLTYKFYNKESDKFVYDRKILLHKDDAAYINNSYPFKIYTPSAQDFKELIDNTEQRYEKNYKNIEGLSGVVYKSKINNNNEIFLPSIAFKGGSEFRNYTTVWDTPKSGYWTSEIADIDRYNDTSYMFIHNKEHVYSTQYWVSVRNMPQLRWYGAQIRPITKKRG